jgi:hypothetical protein
MRNDLSFWDIAIHLRNVLLVPIAMRREFHHKTKIVTSSGAIEYIFNHGLRDEMKYVIALVPLV